MVVSSFTGMSVSMVRGDDFFAKGYGHARLDPPLNWTSQTPAYLGSVGKAITSALLGILMTEQRNRADRYIQMPWKCGAQMFILYSYACIIIILVMYDISQVLV